MGFTSISLEKYIALYLKNNPTESEDELRNNLKAALEAYHNGVKCTCGNDIWVLGSAAVGNSCFTCITGESFPNGDYEIDSATPKNRNIKTARHIDDMDLTKIAGFFTDDGYEINPDLIQKPSLCLLCKNDDIASQGTLCTLTRMNHRDGEEFICDAFCKK